MKEHQLIAVLLAAAVGGCAAPATLSPRMPSVIAVAGRGETSVKPDLAIARLGAEARRPALGDATEDVARRMTAVLERVKSAGVRAEDVATVRYAIDPLAAPRPAAEDVARVVGYRVTNVVAIKVRDVRAVGRVVDAAVAAGANVIEGVHFTLDDRKAAEAVARERAVAAARAKAEELARAAGVRLGALESVSEGIAVGPVVERFAVARQTVGAGPIEPGEQEVSVTVELRYRIEH
jgi:uncharacterized protein YggE